MGGMSGEDVCLRGAGRSDKRYMRAWLLYESGGKAVMRAGGKPAAKSMLAYTGTSGTLCSSRTCGDCFLPWIPMTFLSTVVDSFFL